MSDQEVRALKLPVSLVEMLSEAGFADAVMQASDVAISLSISVDPHRVDSAAAEAFRDLARAVLSIRQAALQVGLDLPLVAVLDLGPEDKKGESYASFRRTFDTWAGEQDWHRGDFAIYLCPPVNPAEEGWSEWSGPRNREEMVQHLLGPGISDWGLISSQLQTEVGVALQLEDWTADHGLDRSDLHGDLVLSAAAALRDLDSARRRDRRETVRRDAEQEALAAISAWVARNLTSTKSSPTESGEAT
jgi:hypothetical protein